MFRKLSISFLLVYLLTITGCQAESVSTTVISKVENTLTATLEADKGGVRGRVFSTLTNEPLVKIGVRLAEVVRQGEEAAFVLDTAFSPGAFTDENGEFVMLNIPVMEYVVVVGNAEIYQGYEILQDSSGKPNTYQVKAGEILELGDLEVSLNNPE